METYAANAHAALASGCGKLLNIDSVAEAQHGLAGARSGGDASADGGGVERGEQRLVAGEGIDLFWIGIRGEPAALE